MTNPMIQKAAVAIANASHVVALTGAGISVESGIPPFRGKGGLWEKFDPMEVAHIQSFLKNPAKVWRLLIKDMKTIMDTAQPNPAHLGLAALEELGLLKTIITQNVDGLHQMAGNTDIIEFHGSFAHCHCMTCDAPRPMQEMDLTTIPPTCECGGIYRPDCVFFGEMIPPFALSRAQEEAAACDVMLVMGTSAVVQPSAFMPIIAKEGRAKIIEINPERTPLSHGTCDYSILQTAGKAMTELVSAVKALL